MSQIVTQRGAVSHGRSARLRQMLRPRSIVFVGGRAAIPAIEYCRLLGFTGRLHVINPHRETLAGIPCARTAADLPEPPDAAFVATPKTAAADALRDLAENGVGAAILNTAGFAETDDNGAGLQRALNEAAGDMPFIGPNCPGLANFLDHVGLVMDNLGEHAPDRGVAVLANGGAYLADICCSDRSLPIAYIAGTGNQANVTVADLLDIVLDDSRVTAVNIYLEALSNVVRLSECAEKAISRGIPVVALKAGRSKSGRQAAQSHTASMAGDAAIASALFRRLGFIEVRTVSEAMETMKMLSFAGAPKGRKVGLVTSSGTYAVLAADMAESVGLSLPPPSRTASDALTPNLEDFVKPANPLDVATGHFWPNERQAECFQAFLSDDYDIAIQVMSFPRENTWEDESWYRSSSVFANEAAKRGLPSAFIAPAQEGLPARARSLMIANGMAPLQGLEDGMKAVAHAVWHAEKRERLNELIPDSIRLTGPAFEDPVGEYRFDEAEAKARLAQSGVDVPRSIVLDARSDPATLDLRFPVALKALSPKILHKSELGAVKIGLNSPTEVRAEIPAMRSRIAEHAPDLSIERFLVEEMVEGATGGLMIGIRHVPKVGQALTLAVGGTMVELLNDAATLLLPVSRENIESTLRALKLFPVLDGWRGRTRADIGATVRQVMAVCAFAESHRETLIEVEINPLLIRPEGLGAVAVDAIIATRN